MPLTASTRIDSSEILALIRSGSVEKVYGTRNPRLNRDSVIKVHSNSGFGRSKPLKVDRNHCKLWRYDLHE